MNLIANLRKKIISRREDAKEKKAAARRALLRRLADYNGVYVSWNKFGWLTLSFNSNKGGQLIAEGVLIALNHFGGERIRYWINPTWHEIVFGIGE